MKKVLIIIIALTGSALTFATFPQASKVIEATKTVTFKRSVSTSSSVHGIPVEIRGVRPRYLKVYNSFKIKNPEDIDSYVNKRQPRFFELARISPERQLEVVISPSRKLSLEEFGRKSEKHGLILEELSSL